MDREPMPTNPPYYKVSQGYKLGLIGDNLVDIGDILVLN
jgi:hypothetical protein